MLIMFAARWVPFELVVCSLKIYLASLALSIGTKRAMAAFPSP